MTIFKSIHMAFYVNTSWACALFRNNKQHVVEGKMLGLPINNNQAKSLPLQREIWRVALPWVRSIQRQRSNWSPTYILHLFHLEDTSLLYLFISELVKVRFLPRVDLSLPTIIVDFVLTFIKWRLTPSYAAKDTIFWQKRPKTIVIVIIVLDDKNSNLFICSSMWIRLERAHC
jgi:hypothetical protein